MATTSSGFLSKSIIVLSILLVSMGVSLFLGKMMGRSIMSLTRTNIEQHFPDSGNSGDNGSQATMVGALGDRSDFGFNPEQFSPEQAPGEWANPEQGQFSTLSDEPVVDIAVLPDQGEQTPPATETGEQKPADSTGEEAKPAKPAEPGSGQSIFDLSGTTIFRISVGTFQNEANAESVWRRLTQAGFEAHISAFRDADGDKFKVYVGTYHTREEADKVAEQLRSMNFDAWVYQER